MATNTTTTLTQEAIDTALQAVSTYKSSCEATFNKMKSDLEALVNQEPNFLGDASTGYSSLYESMKPLLSDKLYGTDSVASLLESLLKAVKDALIGQVDPELKSANENAANAPAAPVVNA